MATEFVERLKSSVDIVKVIGARLPLKKTGAVRYTGLCPFHKEKTPSFSVHAGHQFYYCFGCGAKGDVLKFVMELEQISFYEAARLLAEQHGIPMPRREYADEDTRMRGVLFEAHRIAREAFAGSLAGPAGEQARAYLERRGVTPETAALFGLGYAERTGKSLLRALERAGLTEEQMQASGLVRGEDGSRYDYFRNRLMFPIENESGKTVAFGGRTLEPDQEPKYLNSPETPIYKKSQVLYNLHRAKDPIRRHARAVLVEGYMDVIGVFASGVGEVVASCGTALAGQQVQTLRRHSGRVVVNFDPDTAGDRAAERAIDLLLAEGMEVRILELEGGLDPDEYCRQRGAGAYRERLEGARSYFHWLADRARARFDMRSPEGRVAAFRFLLPSLQRLGDRIERLAVANDLAAYLGVESGALLDQFRKATVNRRDEIRLAPQEPLGAAEKLLLNILLSAAEARRCLIGELRELAHVGQLACGRIFQSLIALEDTGAEFGFQELHDRLDDAGRALLVSAVLAGEVSGEALSIEQGRACVAALRAAGDRLRAAELKGRIRQAERAGKLEEALQLTSELSATGGN